MVLDILFLTINNPSFLISTIGETSSLVVDTVTSKELFSVLNTSEPSISVFEDIVLFSPVLSAYTTSPVVVLQLSLHI